MMAVKVLGMLLLAYITRTTSFILLHNKQYNFNVNSRHQANTLLSLSSRELDEDSPSKAENRIVYGMPRPRGRPTFIPKKNNGHYPSQSYRLRDGHKLQYNEYYLENNFDVILYLCNLSETKENQKTRIIRDYCVKNKKRFLVADWFGRGGSSGKLMEATLTRWTKDTIDFLDGVVPKTSSKKFSNTRRAVFVGSGVGAWVSMLVARERPDLVRGFVGLSADPDFTEDLLWAQLPEEVKDAIMREGFKEVKWGGRSEVYPITSSLIEDGRKNLVLRGGPQSFQIDCPVRLIHSLEDEEVPVTVPLKIAQTVTTLNCEVIMPKIGGHALEDQRQTLPRWVDPMFDQQSKSKTPMLSPFEEALVKSLDDCLQSSEVAAEVK